MKAKAANKLPKKRDIIFVARSPAPHLVRTITLYHDVWYDKIVVGHTEMGPYLEAVRLTVEGPSRICASRTQPGRLVFINTEVTIGKGHPLRVPMDPKQGHGVIATAHFGNRKNEPVVWMPSVKRGDDDG